MSLDDISTALVVSTRNHPAAADLVGYLVNPIPVQLSCSPDMTLGRLTEQAAHQVGRVLPHRHFPGAEIISERRAAGLSALAPSVMTIVADESQPADLLGASVTRRTFTHGSAVAGLSFFLRIYDQRVEVALQYAGNLVSGGKPQTGSSRPSKLRSSAVCGVRSAQ